jgi:hypothetical protein
VSCVDIDKLNAANQLLLSSKVVVENDTLDIIRTHWISNEVTLSNNVTYGWDYVEPRLMNKEYVLLKMDSIKRYKK